MPEDVARAVGASAGHVTIAGKRRKLRPLTVRELAEVERECLKYYKREYLKCYSDNLDLVPNIDREAEMLKKLEEAARWDVRDLPGREVCDPARIQLTPALREYTTDHLAMDTKTGDIMLRAAIAAAVDTKMLTDEEFEALAGCPCPRTKVGYVQWWITGCYEGIVALLAYCAEDEGLSRTELERVTPNDRRRSQTTLPKPQLWQGKWKT